MNQNIIQICDLAIPFLGSCTIETHTYVHQGTCPKMLIAMLFIITLNRKSSKYPLVVGWINKLWYVYIIDYYTAMRVNIMHIITHTLKYG